MDSGISSPVKDEITETATSRDNDTHSKQEDEKEEFLNPNFINIEKTSPLASKLTNFENKVSSDRLSSKSPAQEMAEKMIPIPYKEPPWSGLPKSKYSFDVLKGGLIIESIPFDKPFLVIGRFSQCDVNLQHPSISRFHCIIQHRAEATEDEPCGLYVYDLESTHGTYQNKYRLKPLLFNRLRVGHILKFGKSTRMFILQGPPEDQEAESQYTVTELKALAAEKKLKAAKLKKLEDGGELDDARDETKEKASANASEIEGIDWGMGEDATEEEIGEMNPFAANEELYLEDPKKTLRGWFEREGYDLPNYEVTDISPGHFSCKLELPLPDGGSPSVTCSVDHKGKKKEAVIQCALEACRILDRKGLLRQATHESRKRQKKNWSENDFYASDEDEFLDRTGDIEHKRKMRKRKSESASSKSSVETYDSLTKEYEEVNKEMERLERLIAQTNRVLHQEQAEGEEDLDDFIKNLSSSAADKQKVLDWKVELSKLRKEEQRLRKLVNIARPLGVTQISPKNDQNVDLSSKEDNIKEEKLKSHGAIVTGKTELARTGGKASSLQQRYGAPTKPKNASGSGVHRLFLEEEEPKKMRLTKVDFSDTDSAVKPIPYDEGGRRPHKYKELLRRERGMAMPPPSSEKGGASPLKEAPTATTRVTVPKEFPSEDSAFAGRDSPGGTDPAGPSAPPDVEGKTADESDFKKPDVEAKLRTKRKRKEKVPNPFSFENNYETWVPPSGQTGDGRTALNDKLGY